MSKNMFEWLEDEIAAVKTPRFHFVEGPADAKLRQAVSTSSIDMPSSYKEFVLRFGNAKLYRQSRIGYALGVFAGPRLATLQDGTQLYHLGFHDGASVYIKAAHKQNGFPVFEFEAKTEDRVADNFEDWLATSAAKIRSAYGKKKWTEILRGPQPFSAHETELLQARQQFSWRILGVDESGRQIIEVCNGSKRMLPALTLGVRSKDGRLNGAVRLSTQNLMPRETTTLHVDCYKDLRPANEIEVFALPEPQPEDRNYYWEFERN